MPETVLIVDDDRAIAMLAALWLEDAGFAPVVVNSGKAALELVAAQRFGAILLDIRMPDLDGFEVFKLLRQMPEAAGIPVIFLSANAHEAARREALSAGARCFLSKPYEARDLVNAVRRALQTTTQTTPQTTASPTAGAA